MGEIFQNTELAQIIQMVRELKSPKALAKARKNPIDFFAQFGMSLPANVDYDIHLNDEQYFYFVLPIVGNSELTHDFMNQLAAGKNSTYSSFATVGTLTTFSSLTTSVTAATLSSLVSVASLSSGDLGKIE